MKSHTKNLLLIGVLLFSPYCLRSQIKVGPHSLESHGYLRTGFGRSFSGGEMVQFQAPGTMAKARFGNEANHYSELQFNYKYQPEDRDDSYEVVYMMATYLPYTSEDLTKAIRPETTQLYFKWNKLYNDADFWIGRRYYQRENIDILDWFWLNSAQNADIGAGLENIKVGTGNENLNVAVMRFSDKLIDPNASNQSVEDYKMDVRLKQIAIGPQLNLNLLAQYGVRPSNGEVNYKKQTGYALGAWSDYKKNNLYNRTSLIYRKGINMVQNPYTGKSLLEFDVTGQQVYNLEKASDLQVTTDLQIDDHSKNGFLGALTYHHKNFGVETESGNNRIMNHYNATGRYTRYLTDRFNLTFDAGYDFVKHTDGAQGSLFKFTFSPEIKWSKGMFSRPTIRPFVTYATWSKELRGMVGVFNDNKVYEDKTNGFTGGLQLELWW